MSFFHSKYVSLHFTHSLVSWSLLHGIFRHLDIFTITLLRFASVCVCVCRGQCLMWFVSFSTFHAIATAAMVGDVVSTHSFFPSPHSFLSSIFPRVFFFKVIKTDSVVIKDVKRYEAGRCGCYRSFGNGRCGCARGTGKQNGASWRVDSFVSIFFAKTIHLFCLSLLFSFL